MRGNARAEQLEFEKNQLTIAKRRLWTSVAIGVFIAVSVVFEFLVLLGVG